MSFASDLALAAVPAAIAASVTYGVTRAQGRQQREAMQAELVRLRASAEEDRLRQRQAAYQELLNASAFMSDSDWRAPRTRDDVEAAKRRLRDAIHAVELFGSEGARVAAGRLELVHDRANGDEYDDHVQWRSACRAARSAFTAAARLDVGPEAGSG